MPNNNPPKPLTQSVVWHRQYLLFNTTNRIDIPYFRRSLAARGDEKTLRDTCITTPVTDQHDWGTPQMLFNKLRELIMDECLVGRHGTKLWDCVNAIRQATERHQVADLCQARLYKTGSEVGLVLSNLRGREAAIADDVKHDVNMIAANGGTSEVGQDTILFKWQIPLTREVSE